MSQHVVIDWLDNPRPGEQPGDIDDTERWWVDRQVALEKAGYMLRSRYRPGWKPSWAGTKKFYQDCEDGQSIEVSNNHPFTSELPVPMTLDATRHGRNSNF